MSKAATQVGDQAIRASGSDVRRIRVDIDAFIDGLTKSLDFTFTTLSPEINERLVMRKLANDWARVRADHDRQLWPSSEIGELLRIDLSHGSVSALETSAPKRLDKDKLDFLLKKLEAEIREIRAGLEQSLDSDNTKKAENFDEAAKRPKHENA